MRRAPVRRVLAAVALAALLASCQGRPPDTVALSIYHRNLSDEPFTYSVLGTHPEGVMWIGEVPDVVSSAGCGFAGRDWELLVSAGTEPPDPAGEVAARLSGGDIGNPDTVALSISVRPDGSVVIGGGVPPWWDSDIQRCPGA